MLSSPTLMPQQPHLDRKKNHKINHIITLQEREGGTTPIRIKKELNQNLKTKAES